MFRRAAVMAVVLLAVLAAARAWGVEVKKDIVFSSTGGMELKGDIYIPDGDGPFPGVLYLHGGGFVAGYKDYPTQLQVINNLAENGFLVFSADYRLLSQGGMFPENIKDAKCALCWLKRHGPEYGMKDAPVGVLGESAGAYLAAMIAVTPGLEDFEPECEAAEEMVSDVAAAVLVYAPSNIPMMKNNLSKLLITEVKRATKIKDKKKIHEMMVKLSPMFYAANAVPTLLLHGKEDVLVPVEQSRMFSQALEKEGRDVTYMEFVNAPHGFLSDYFDSEAGKKGNAAAIEFLKKHLVETTEAEKAKQ